ncbi:uncharacterized protein NP_1372A [Natronomonas pharaonis DSM 2160]|uniref:DUF7847 domain-containing protein n=1 Tax=Natronomonas pharaonis (strain ATCC 35678 / DSM 2160 / CIP 103997 / JCM 8858 / NBRC 14720 / NCIMB 2260 / Gabara) TaxID=348780 RepID=A0A1U7EUW9_NATPD|nr:hypothetical protein [Natronomonas pharaonis]CAI48777.1 uncharacterized protein NP_1372A [Natronomonas pharaonis DSM 2160]
MGHALAALGDSIGTLRRTPAAAGLLGLLAIVVYSLYLGLWFVPYVGWLLSIVVFALGAGALYAVASTAIDEETASIAAAVDVIRERWLSLLGAYGMLILLFIGVLALVFVLLLVAAIAGAATMEVVDDPTAAGGFLILVAVLYVGLYLLYALVAQFVFPAVAIERTSAVDSVGTAYSVVRSAPVSVVGFTLLRVVIEYGFLILGVVGAAAVAYVSGGETLAETDPEAVDPTILAGAVDTVGIVVALGILLFGAALGQLLRITYTAAFYKRIREPGGSSAEAAEKL